MVKRALVLGGGGSIGVAWETALVAGLLEAGVDLAAADLIVGTSAGSIVGTQLALGLHPPDLLQAQLAPEPASPPLAEPDLLTMREVSQRWNGAQEMHQALRQELGALALRARTAPEEAWVGFFAGNLAGATWPERALKITGVAADTGDFVTWDRYSGVPLAHAVAASCTVPGLFPPVSIGGRRFVDGGVRSVINGDLAQGHDVVVIIAPIANETAHPLGYRQLTEEAAALRAAGAQVIIILPDDAALAAFGPSMMDATRRIPGAQAGLRQAKAVAERLKAVWG